MVAVVLVVNPPVSVTFFENIAEKLNGIVVKGGSIIRTIALEQKAEKRPVFAVVGPQVRDEVVAFCGLMDLEVALFDFQEAQHEPFFHYDENGPAVKEVLVVSVPRNFQNVLSVSYDLGGIATALGNEYVPFETLLKRVRGSSSDPVLYFTVAKADDASALQTLLKYDNIPVRIVELQ